MEQKNDSWEGSPWFWKLFGGTLIGFIGILLMLVINNIIGNQISTRAELNSVIAELKSESSAQITKLKDEVSNLKAQVAAVDEFKDATKDKLTSVDNLLKDHLESCKEVAKEQETQLRDVREKFILLEGKVKTE